ncbi:cytochrome P450 4C1-like [Ostrinia furnacalis]|uniref:cytochrome P450 4C1-like n=1 Tax=Ostrinia furnacalis TaxID=93504 RepID=UPI00103B3492|nr:cytochrome P450 4C1-like [Ostrinia furnacalis]
MFVWLLLVTALLALAVYRFRRRNMYRLASLLPGSDHELPLVGIAFDLAGNTENVMQQLITYSYIAMRNGGLMRAWCGPILFIVMVDPVDLEFVMKHCLEKGNLHKFSRNVIGNGGIFAPVSIWRRRRKILVPTFSPKIVETFVEVFSKQSEKLANILASSANIGEVRMWTFLSTYTLDSVCETTMGVKINSLENPDTPFLVAMTNMLHLVCERFFHIWLQPNWMYRLFPQHKKHDYYLKSVHNFADEVIKKKREEVKNNTQNETETKSEFDLSNYQTKTFLDHLIKLSGGDEGYTNVELREEILMLAVAGTDTSAVAVGFTMKLLAKYPHIQEQVYQELHEIFGNSDRRLVKEDLPRLKCMDRVVRETMRLFPPVPLIARQVVEDIKLPSGHILPAGGTISISIWGAHRDPKYWGPNAEEFDPDRFLPERFNLTHPCSFMPFSQGPRNCVGYQYAMMSIKTVLSAVLRRYKLVGEPEETKIPHIRVKVDLMLKDVDGFKVCLEQRKLVTQ